MSPRKTRSRVASESTSKKESTQERQTGLKDYFNAHRPGRNASKAKEEINYSNRSKVLSQAKTVREFPSPPKMKREDSPETVVPSVVPRPISPPAQLKISSPQKLVARKLFISAPKPSFEKPETPNDTSRQADEWISAFNAPNIFNCYIFDASLGVKAKKAIRSVQELQAKLAEKGASQKIHLQNIRRKDEQSPTKTIPIGPIDLKKLQKSPQKRVRPKRTESDSNGVKVRNTVQDYILPTPDRTPAKVFEKESTPEEKTPHDYGKTSLLKDEIKQSVHVPLPTKYESLHDKFQHFDRVLSIMMQQEKRITLNDANENVRKSTKKEFNNSHFAQFLHLYPAAFIVKLKEKWNAFGGVQKGKYDHVVKPNIVDDLKECLNSESNTKNVEDEPAPLVTPSRLCSPTKGVPRSPKKAVKPMPREAIADTRPRLEGWRMTCRAHVFRYKLSGLVYKSHEEWLHKMGFPSTSVPILKLHPSFECNLNDECKPIAEAVLPSPPENERKGSTMAEYLRSVDDALAELPKGVQSVLDALKSPAKTTATGVPLSPKKFAEKPTAKMSILERIRAKGAAKREAEMLRNPIVERKMSLLDGLSKRYLTCITSLYAIKKARSLELNFVIEKTIAAFGGLSRADAIEQLEVLCASAPAYFSKSEVMGKKYLQLLNNNYELILAELKQEIAALT